jgi:hypothetical protein
MKKLIFIFVVLMLGACVTPKHIDRPFYRETKNKPLKGRMTTTQVQNARYGETLYYRDYKGRVRKR